MAGNILQWIKANLLIVISIALIIILLPVGWFFSSGWNSSIQEKASKAYSDEKSKLTRASSIEYSLPAVLKGEQALTENRAPNTIVTDFYLNQIDQRKLQVQQVVERGTAFNKADHTVPLDGLLPEAASPSELRKNGSRLGELIAGTLESPSLYTRLLRKLNAGDAPDAAALASSLSQFKTQQQEQYAATSSDGRISVEQTKLLEQDLIKRRLGEYASKAESIAFYCPLTAIQSETPELGYSHVPAIPPNYDSITEQAVFTWVWDYWVISDVLRAASAANTDASGVSLPVPDAPIKHVELIRVSEFAVATGGSEFDDIDSGGRGARGGRGFGNDDDFAAPSGPKFYTGRTQSNAYDIRTVDLTVIASSKQLPKFFDALAKTNYMTVIDVDLSEVDVYDALSQGYYYGQDHLVRANIKIETVWLRSWTAESMPKSIRDSLGIVLDSDVAEDMTEDIYG